MTRDLAPAGLAQGRTTRAHRRAVLAAIARREWLLQMLALGAAGCRRAEDRAYARGNTLIVGVEGYWNDRPLTPDEIAEWLVYLPLVRVDDQGDRQPCLATHWEHSADYLEWTYRLRPGVRWHDGRPVTVDDVKFTIDSHAHPDSPVFSLQRTECTVHDQSTFTVRGLNWTRGTAADTYVTIVPKHLLKDLDYQKWYEWDFWLRPVGNGPYRYVRYQPRTMVELEANPDYYKGRPTIERVVLKFTEGASLAELLSGNVDAVRMRNPAQLSVVANDPRFQTYWPLLFGERRFWAILWQNEHPLFRDPDVRRALSLAINRRELVQFLNLPTPFALVDVVYTERQARRGEGSEPRYDPAEARRLLDASGWRQRRGDGVRERSGRDFHFTALTLASFPGVEAAVYVQDQLKHLGVRMDVQPLAPGVFQSRMKARDFEAGVSTGGGLGGLDAIFGEQSLLGYRSPRMTKLLEVLRTTADPEAVDQAHREMSDLLRGDQPIAFLFKNFGHAHVVHRRVKGLSAPWRADPIRFIDDVWLQKQP